MSNHESLFEAAQRARWLRPDAYRWIRPDAARFLAPGTDPASVFPALHRKFSPDQPRVPAGNPDGGQWTDGGGGGGGINDPRVLSDADPEGIRPYEQYAQNLDKRPVDLREEEARGGHALRKHVGKTDEELLASTTVDRGQTVTYRYARKINGSFASMESANDFVNRTLEQNRDRGCGDWTVSKRLYNISFWLQDRPRGFQGRHRCGALPPRHLWGRRIYRTRSTRCQGFQRDNGLSQKRT